MRIGLTYDLRSDYEALGFSGEAIAEFDSERTITAIEETLCSLGHNVERVGNIWRLTEALAAGRRWELVFNIAEGMVGLAREAQVPALLDAYRIPYTFSAPDVLVLCHNKALAKRMVEAAGIRTAPFQLVRSWKDAAQITLPYPLFVKPLAEGTGKGISDRSLVTTPEHLKEYCQELLARFAQPVLVETYLPGREFTVGILGSGEEAESLGALEIQLNPGAETAGHTYQNKEQCETRVTYTLCTDAEAQQAEALALAAWRTLGCRDGGRIDIRCDAAGIPHFLEANPLAGLNPGHSDLPILAEQAGLSYRALLQRIMNSAMQRVI